MRRNNELSIRLENIHPILSVKDLNISRAFYINILGFKEADWGDDNFTSMSRDNCVIYLCRGEQGNPGTWIWIGFDGDIFSLHNELKEKGVTIRLPPSITLGRWKCRSRIRMVMC
jgi:catechol 2,3-dioxygenase-like lactoylglutathione lyase family enzyme